MLGLAARRPPRRVEVLLRLLSARLFESVQTAVEEGRSGARGVQGQLPQPLAGQNGVLVLPERLLHVLHHLREGGGARSEDPAHRLPCIAGLLGGLPSVVQELFPLGSRRRGVRFLDETADPREAPFHAWGKGCGSRCSGPIGVRR